jgi:hypothetical protein
MRYTLIVKRLENQIFEKSLRASKPKGLHRIAKICYGYICLREIDLSFSELHLGVVPFKHIYRGGSRGGAPPKIGKNMIFWRKIVIFHTKYPKNFRASLGPAQFF